MHSISMPAVNSCTGNTRVVWLPGAYHAAKDFLEAGFPAAVVHRQAAIDLVFVDLELRHLEDRTGLARMRSEIVLPARSAGLSVWLGGISLGGLFALHYALAFPGDLDGLCLLAPYLGNRILTAEIVNAPGLAAWEPGKLADSDDERQIWRFIKTRDAAKLPIYLGFGQHDRFAAAHHLLAANLPREAVDVIDGGHDWPTWSALWGNFLDARVL